METRIVEITEFVLKPGFTDEAFLQTADDVNEAARKLKGFQNRRLLKSERGWVEVIEWADMQSAKSAGEVWATLPGLGTYCSMVDHNSLKFGYHPIVATAGARVPGGPTP